MTRQIPFVWEEDGKSEVSYKRFNGIILPSFRGCDSLRLGAITEVLRKFPKWLVTENVFVVADRKQCTLRRQTIDYARFNGEELLFPTVYGFRRVI
jgi:hypothetical protein